MTFWQTITTVLVVSIALGLLLLLWGRVAIVAAAARSRPSVAQTPLASTGASSSVAEAIADIGVLRAEWRAYQKHLDSYLEAFNDLEETIEHKRRRTTAAASKIQRDQEAPEPTGHAALLSRARTMGLPV